MSRFFEEFMFQRRRTYRMAYQPQSGS